MYASAARDDIIRRRNSWPSQYFETSFTTIPNQSQYSLSEIAPGVNVETILSIIHPRVGPLKAYGIIEWESRFLGGADQPSDNPYGVIIGPQNIRLIPAPAGQTTLTVVGYERFADWPTTGLNTTGLPQEFDMPISWAMCRDWFNFQEEPEMAAVYNARFESDVAKFIGKLSHSFGSYADPNYFTVSPRSRRRISPPWVRLP
jgi:hypothetical protein